MKAPSQSGDGGRSPQADRAAEASPDQTRHQIVGPLMVVPGTVSDAERARARRIFEATFGAAGPAEPKEAAPEDSNIDVGEGKEKRVKLDPLLADALAKVGYRRVAKLAYRAERSTDDVEHVLSFDTYGTPNVYLRGDAGLRNRETEQFVSSRREQYQPALVTRTLRSTGYRFPPWFCAMHFSLGAIAEWGIQSSVDTTLFSPDELARKVQEAVQGKLAPYVGDITTTAKLLEFLERDEEPMRWFRIGGYARAAYIAYLAAKLGRDPSETRRVLVKYGARIVDMIDQTRLTLDTFIEELLGDAEAAVQANSKQPGQ
ncbi:hypothetical protein DFR50_107146 [Roseiarcus fermentans]|uniref:Uncharacterized protein n=2 Tax=Roseiarcus fermentans TaxID=1473586 RepID=A0A366FP14_9HYPH|nr:hypothetical protein DFR50_107146 [Roseiarcus fermentans]